MLAILTSVVSDNMIAASARFAEEQKRLEVEEEEKSPSEQGDHDYVVPCDWGSKQANDIAARICLPSKNILSGE
jgi:hypothetical protein